MAYVKKKRDQHLKVNGWTYWCYICAPTVIMAETPLNFYNEDTFHNYRKRLKREKCRAVWSQNKTDIYRKKSTYMEVYKVVPEDITFEEKIKILQAIIDKVKIEDCDEEDFLY